MGDCKQVFCHFRRCLSAFGFLLLFYGVSYAQGEHARRAGAQLHVILGDAARLLNEPDMPLAQRRGLKERLGGALAGLGFLLRLADQETGGPMVTNQVRIKRLRADLAGARLRSLIGRVESLIRKYPLISPNIFSPSDRASTIHSEFCAACHDEPDLTIERPAFNLFKQAKRQSAREFLARLIIGVRGDRVTGYGNPLSDADLFSLIKFYRTAKR